VVRYRKSGENGFDGISISVDISDEDNGTIIRQANESRGP